MTASDLQELLGQAETDSVRAEGKAAQAHLVENVNELGSQASARVLKQPKKYKNLKSKVERVPIQQLMAAARTGCADWPPVHSQCSILKAAPSHVLQATPEAACLNMRLAPCSHLPIHLICDVILLLWHGHRSLSLVILLCTGKCLAARFKKLTQRLQSLIDCSATS
ncbi:hypothetical protein Esti_006647 [Eimeria stiedai]